MDAITFSAITKSLDLLSQRQAFTAQNIANANSLNYRPVRLQFEDELSAAMAKGPEFVEKLAPRIEQQSIMSDEPGVRIDLELAQAQQTALRYSALMEVLGRHLSLADAAVKGGH